MRKLEISSHLGTHINIPSHMVKDGKTLDDLSLSNYCGQTVVYQEGMKIEIGTGLIFSDMNIDEKLMSLIVKVKPKFIGLSVKFEFDIEIENNYSSMISFLTKIWLIQKSCQGINNLCFAGFR